MRCLNKIEIMFLPPELNKVQNTKRTFCIICNIHIFSECVYAHLGHVKYIKKFYVRVAINSSKSWKNNLVIFHICKSVLLGIKNADEVHAYGNENRNQCGNNIGVHSIFFVFGKKSVGNIYKKTKMQPQGDQKGREREAGVTLATKKNDMSSYQQHGGGMCAA